MKKNLLQILLTIVFTSFLTPTNAQHSIWNEAKENRFDQSLIEGPNMPLVYKIFELDFNAFKTALTQAPSESTTSTDQSDCVISFPSADGSIKYFRVLQAPVMHPDLAAKYPGINSYIGRGIEDPTSTVRFDISPDGTNAIIMSGRSSSIYVDHISGNYYRVTSRDFFNAHKAFNCNTPAFTPSETGSSASTNRPEDATQPKLRTYKLALLSGAEFSLHFVQASDVTTQQKKARVLAAQNTIMTRTNAIFERDFAIRLVLIPTNDTLIYLTASSDPISNASSPSGSTCQTAMNTRVGNANYNIGHTQSKGSDNGNAGCIGCVCVTGKGLGWTVYNNPSLLNYYVVDYMAHEMGHQMGANHTFTFNLEGSTVQVEPGSGITVMGYAGITGSTDVAAHSIDNFHSKSVEQVTTYMYSGSGNGCAVAINNNNQIPTATAGSDYTIPKSTPFILNGSGSDADVTDSLTYCWEQIDLKTSSSNSSIPNSSFTTGPMFRSYSPTTNPKQFYPQLQYVLTGANGTTWERLPSVARTMNFRILVRDNHIGGGGNKSDNMVVTVATSGPFSVSAPNTSVTWAGGSSQTITWSVNNTTAAPVSCANVKISLSTDGGQTFPTVLAASTANDGTETVALPNIATTTARIKVEAVGNIFYDISNTNFIITSTVPVTLASFDAMVTDKNKVKLNWSVANATNLSTFEIERSINATNWQFVGYVNANNTSTQSNYESFDNSPLNGVSYYRLKLVDADRRFVYSEIKKVNISKSVKDIIIIKPINSNLITLQLNNGINNEDITGITVYASNGQKIYSSQQYIQPINLGKIAKGTYIVNVNTNNGNFSEKIVY
jgi:hypothetical protein